VTDTELLALAALVNGYAAETSAANMDRQVHGYAMAYNGIAGSDALEALDNELRRRELIGALRSPQSQGENK